MRSLVTGNANDSGWPGNPRPGQPLLVVTHNPEVASYANWALRMRDGTLSEVSHETSRADDALVAKEKASRGVGIHDAQGDGENVRHHGPGQVIPVGERITKNAMGVR